MERKSGQKTIAILILIAIGAAFSILLLSVILMSSSNSTGRFFGALSGLTIIALLMLISGFIQFVPSIFKGRSRFIKVLLWVMGFLWISMSGLIFEGLLPDYYKDIPNALYSSYSMYDGTLTEFHISHGRRSVRTYFTIDDKKFDINGEYHANFLIKGRKYHIEYLPHSRFVMRFYRYGK